MKMIDNILFLMKIGDHYNLQTKVTPCMNIIETAVTYFKRRLKTALKHVSSSMRLMSSRQRPSRSEYVHNPDPGSQCMDAVAPGN